MKAGCGVVLAHPSGNQFFRHLAVALRDSGLLSAVCTCLDWRSRGLDQLVPKSLSSELGRREFSHDLGVPVHSHPWKEAARLAAGKLHLGPLIKHETGRFSVDAVYRDFDKWTARKLRGIPGASIAYAYEDAAEAIFAEASRLGWVCAYDLPIAYWETSRRLLDEESALRPEWEPTLGGTRDSLGKLERKTNELRQADVVVCPSQFVAGSLPAWARESKTVVVAPFGSPAPNPREVASACHGRQKLRVLFAGAMTQRKGLADLFEAVRRLDRADLELVVMGSPTAPMSFYRSQLPTFTYEAPRPHDKVLALMRTCDLLCLPSIVEGRALVIQEAMSQGLPAIVTPNTGADDVVRDGATGFIVPIRSPEKIAERLNWCADHRSEMAGIGSAARDAAARLSWDRYGASIAGILLQACQPVLR